MALYEDITKTVGGTPAVRVRRLAPEGAELWVKVEAANPLGSVKDRLALGVIEDAERRGLLAPGQTVVEATSGNTGIGLAMVCAAKGYPLVVVMPENFSVERRKIMRYLGARVVLTPAPLRGTGMLAKAVELAEHHGWFLCRQFENEANAEIHSKTTAVEIVDDFAGRRLDYWVTGFGTGGTLKGVARVLRERRPDTRIVVCEPDNSGILASDVEQPRDPDGSPSDSHPAFRTHLVQGWSPDFIPKLAEDAKREKLIDAIVPVNSGDALRLSRELARQEGIFTGISGGATLAGALRICRNSPAGTAVLCMLPDTGERYLSTPLFDDITAEMTEEEEEISRSTPNYRFDVAADPQPVAAVADTTLSADAEAWVAEALADASRPVVVFALEWCEFCWSVRKLFEALDVPYRPVDLDSAATREGALGDRIRDVLQHRTGSRTVPQVFIGGERVGGCTEVFEAYKSGELQRLLAAHGVDTAKRLESDPYGFLPSWLHPR
ncbi:MAG: pyridoxal-phosphate dependent enzyme [Candidatus Eiseniibacteriota bacterium]|jgi:cysteine synthase A